MKEILNVSLVQTSLAWEAPALNREHFDTILEKVDPDTQLVVLPEMFSTGFTMEPQNLTESQAKSTLLWMQEQAFQKGMAVVGSLVWPENGKYFNRLFFVFPDGTYQHYNKRHTFTLAGEDKIYSAGQERLIVDYAGFKICPLICYDLRFPVWSRNTLDYDVLIYVANWPEPRVDAWDSLLKARAIENMSYSIGVNRVGSDANGHTYVGHSAVYDLLGVAKAFSKEDEILFATIDKSHIEDVREKLKFLQDRDSFSLE
ncbi:MAG: nitrilase family protein [Eudoraea sp.]|nr:nitrilase family protein [Eudoraea sp.]